MSGSDTPAWPGSAPTTVLPGVGPGTAEKLAASGIRTVADLLFLLPRRYREVRELELPEEDALGEMVRVRGRVVAVRRRWLPGKRSLVTVELACPGGAAIVLPFYNQPYLAHGIRSGETRTAEGHLDRAGRRFKLKMPKLLPKDFQVTGAVQLVYPEVDGVSDARVRTLVELSLDGTDLDTLQLDPVPVPLPETLDLAEALRHIHRPHDVAQHETARQHFAVREAVQLFRRVERARRGRAARTGPDVAIDDALDARIAARIPFEWTGDQARAVADLRERLGGPSPMGVLLQGDVGTGKTAVAVYAALAAIARGHQVAFLAPTELLAEQHHLAISPWLEDSDVRVELLTASQSQGERREKEASIAEGSADLVFGTHALTSERTSFANLGLVIVDEQHRFGVEQRMKLIGKGRDPHVLVMTATPIPRTLTLALFGDLDALVLREKPPGRTPSRAVHVPPEDWSRILATISRRVRRNQRVYVVCPKVGEGGEKGGAVFLAEELARRFDTGLVHGKMPSAERQRTTQAFRDGEVEVLVGTTVLEVGVDVARATLMVVVACDRFGLSTLHQLRGRVGRGGLRGLCILTGPANARTKALCRTTDGFELAEEDLRLRGTGELMGRRQSGDGELRALDIVTDRDLLHSVRDAVRTEFERAPSDSENFSTGDGAVTGEPEREQEAT